MGILALLPESVADPLMDGTALVGFLSVQEEKAL